MYCTVREYKLKPSEDADALIGTIREKFVPVISRASGFVSYSVAVNTNRDLITVGFFTGREGAEESTSLAADFVKHNVASAVEGPPRVTAGEVLVFERIGGQASFGVLRRSRTRPGKRDELLKMIGTKIMPMVKEVDGFVSGSVVDAGPDELLVVAAYRDHASADVGTNIAIPYLTQHAGDLITGPPEMIGADIKLREVKEAAFAG